MGRKGYGEVGTQTVLIVERLKIIVIEDPAAPGTGIHMLPPAGHGSTITGNSAGGENGVPQGINGITF